jgi:MarR family transcriptional regulator, 2-MHQ and catechol-resistance regulon repressor
MIKQQSSDYLRNQVWVLLHYTHDMIMKNEEDMFRLQAGVSYQHFMVLMAMESVGRPVKEAVLVRLLQRNPNTVSMITDRMEKIGLVKKIRSRTDRRLVEVEMTQTGKDNFKKAFKVGNDLVRQLLPDFSDNELKQFVQLLDKVSSNAAHGLGLKDKPAEVAAENIENLVTSIKKPIKM